MGSGWKQGWRRGLPIILVGVLLRLPGCGVPPGLHPDEGATALEADALRRTGRSTDGRLQPLVVQMHGRVWAEATYVWLAAPCSALPVPVEVWVRLPAALAGMLLLPLGFALARRLLSERQAHFALLFLALEPMAWHYSRLALRATLVPPLIVGGLLVFLHWRARAGGRRGVAWGLAGGALLALAAWTYTPVRLVAVVLFAGLAWSHRRDRLLRTALLAGAGVLGVTLLASLPWSLSEAGRARFAEISIFARSETLGEAAWAFAKGYALHFSPRLLFSGSSSSGFWAEGVPPLLWVEAPLLLLGIWRACLAVRRRRGSPEQRLLLVWLLAHPLAAALTLPAPNPLRAIVGLPLWCLLAANGTTTLAALARRAGRRRARALGPTLVVLALGCASWSAWQYFWRFPGEEGRFWYANAGRVVSVLLFDAQEKGYAVEIRCGWLEAELLAAHGLPVTSTIVREGPDRATVVFDSGPQPGQRFRFDPMRRSLTWIRPR